MDQRTLAELADATETIRTVVHGMGPALQVYVREHERIQDLTRSIRDGLGLYLDRLNPLSEASRLTLQLREQIEGMQKAVMPLAKLSFDTEIMKGLNDALSVTSFYGFDAVIKQIQAASREVDWSALVSPVKSFSQQVLGLFRPSIEMYDTWRASLPNLRQSADEIAHLMPVRERFLTEDLRISLGVIVGGQAEDQRRSLLKQTDEHVLLTLADALKEVDPRLLRLWEGGWHALQSSNPDKIRHALVSLRELVTQILHKLSPDAEVLAWDVAQQHQERGRPTRRGRLLYIYSRVQGNHFRDFIAAEIQASLELVDLFQSGTHNVELPLTADQLAVILRKVHSMICSLVELRLRN